MPRFAWTRELTDFFVQALVDECRAGNRPNKTLNKIGKDNVVKRMRDHTGHNWTRRRCIYKWDELRQKWSCWKRLIRLTGVTFHPMTKLIDMPGEWWEAQIQANEVASVFQNSRLQHEEQLDYIFAKMEPQNIGPNESVEHLSLPPPPPPDPPLPSGGRRPDSGLGGTAALGGCEMESLAQRAALLRESLQRSQQATDAVVSILGSFDSRLSALNSAMRPIQVRTHAVWTAHENIDRTLRSADVILTQFDRTREAEREMQKGPHENLQGFLDAVDRLRSIERFFSSNRSYRSSDGVLSHVKALLSKALVKIKGEFQTQLSQHSKPIEPKRLFICLRSTLQPSAGSHTENQQNSGAVYSSALIEPKFIPLLAKLAQQLVQAGWEDLSKKKKKKKKAGWEEQCLKIYSKARASALESSLEKLGVKKLKKHEEMPWEILDCEIDYWILFMRIAVKFLFAAERQLCDQVFECKQSLADECLAAITKKSLATLHSFGEAICMSKRSPEKPFVLLDEIMPVLQNRAPAMRLFSYLPW